MAPSSTSHFDQIRQEYDDQALMYNSLLKLPFGKLENQLFASAIRSDDCCRGASVLDLGGGTGLRARQVLEAGAAQVDIVDFSPEMMAVGKRDAEKILGEEARKRLRWFLGDVSKPLFGEGGVVGLRDSYDVVMANWIFDHVGSVEVLEAMWHNISAAVRPGGRFVGVRACDPRTKAMTTGKYGPSCQDFVEFTDGLSYNSTIPVEYGPPVKLENLSLKISYSGSTEMHDKYGFSDVVIEPYENAEVVQADPEFWKLWLEQPGFAIVKALKK
ncbi:methyltransferase-like protein [Camillea tinctor]|nr:methyltransferase-like protein [Camillea tinctor]